VRSRRAPAGPPAPPTRRRRWPKIVLAVVTAFAVLVVGLFLFGWWQFGRIPKVDVSAALSSASGAGTNYLIVGSDSREGIAPDDPNAGAFLAEGIPGQRTDTIMVLRVEGSTTALLSIPRDLLVTNPVTGERGRINSLFQSGPAALIEGVEQLGIPVHHYLEIDFVSFGRLVDAVGGITIDFAHPARDANSGLDVPTAGAVTLDGSQALAYVRSRYYEELVDGGWRADPTGDLGRVDRQRLFLSALVGELGGTRNPVTLARVSSSFGDGMRIDDDLTYLGALGLAWRLRGFGPESLTLPGTPRTTSGGAAILDLDAAAAQPIIDRFAA
jgi:LCP family protein required for cell wall assembly